MSFSGGNTGGVAAAPLQQRMYICHQCNRTFTIPPSPSSDLLCPTCNGGFVQEFQSHNSSPNPGFTLNPNPSPMDAVFLDDPSTLLGMGPSRSFNDSSEFNPFLFLQNYLQTLRAGGANSQVVIENNSSIDPTGSNSGNRGSYPRKEDRD